MLCTYRCIHVTPYVLIISLPTGWHDISASISVKLLVYSSVLVWTNTCRENDGHEGIYHCSDHDVIYLNCFLIKCTDCQVGQRPPQPC